ncbi:MAG: hypothetical protein ACRDVZ_01190, partial [Jiangellaceae bacterium]
IPARSCDIDHRHPRNAGGTIGEANNEALARRFHIDETLHGWKLAQPERGSMHRNRLPGGQARSLGWVLLVAPPQ